MAVAGVPTTQQVLQNLTLLHSSASNKATRNGADDWLQECRRHPQAWHIFGGLLADGSDPQAAELRDARVFAAQSLKWRVGNELPQGQLARQYRQGVLGLVARYSAGPRRVLTQLAIAYVKLIAVDREVAATEEVREFCTTLGRPETVKALLMTLTIYAEEAADRDKGCGSPTSPSENSPARRGKVHRMVVGARDNGDNVIQLLHQVHSSGAAHDEACEVLESFGRWIRFASDAAAAQLHASPLTQLALASLDDDELRSTAVEVLTELARVAGAEPSRFGSSVSLLTAQLPVLWEKMQVATRERDDDAAKTLCKGLCSIATSFASLIAQSPSADSAHLISMLAQAMKHPERDVSELTFPFWERLAEVLVPSSAGQDERDRILQVLGPPLMELVDGLVFVARTPEDFDKPGWRDDDDDDLRKWRSRTLSDTVEACGQILTPRQAALRAVATLDAACRTGDWRGAESVLVFVRFLQIPDSLCDEMLPQLFSNFTALPQHWKVRDAFTYLIGKYGWWLERRGEQFLPALLAYVAESCSDRNTAPTAAVAIRLLCERCARPMLAQFGSLLMLCEQSHSLAKADQDDLMQGLGTVVCGLPEDQLPRAIEALWGPALTRIRQLAQSGEKKGVALELRRLVALSKGASEGCSKEEKAKGPQRRKALGQMWSASFSALWPTLHAIMSTLSNDDVMEELTALLRHVLKTCDTEFAPHLGQVIDILIGCFRHTPYSCIPWVTASFVGIFGWEAACIQPLVSVVTTLSELTIALLQTVDVGQNSDFVTEMFYLHDRAMCRFPQEMLASPVVPQVFILAVSALTNSDVKVQGISSILDYFDVMTNCEDERCWKDRQRDGAACAQFLTAPAGPELPQRGQMLAASMLRCAVDRNTEMASRVADIFYQLHRNCETKGVAPQWLHGGLAELSDCPAEARQECLQSAQQAEGRSDFRGAIKDLHRAIPKNWR